MPLAELEEEVEAGVSFWGAYEQETLLAVMGLQPVADVALVRHAYTRTKNQGQGLGKALLEHVLGQTQLPILIGTWAAATWAIGFYQSQGFQLVHAHKDALLRRYWRIPPRQVEDSVVLANSRWSGRSAASTET